MLTKKSLAAKETNYSHRNILIVGGGPAGLATALMLAKRGWTNVTVLEKRAAADYYEPDKSFNYLIDSRGQKLTDLLGITHQLSKISVPSTEFFLTRIKPNGSRKTLKLPSVDPNRKTAYWLPRGAFLLLKLLPMKRTAVLPDLSLVFLLRQEQTCVGMRDHSSAGVVLLGDA